jgi:hypothetical protein
MLAKFFSLLCIFNVVLCTTYCYLVWYSDENCGTAINSFALDQVDTVAVADIDTDINSFRIDVLDGYTCEYATLTGWYSGYTTSMCLTTTLYYEEGISFKADTTMTQLGLSDSDTCHI